VLVGLAPIAGEPKRVASVALAAPHAPSSAAVNPRLRASLPLSAGNIAAREKESLVAVFCPK